MFSSARPSSPFSRNRRLAAKLQRRALLEQLEDRALLSTFTVINADDAGPGSLRQMILDANANPGIDQINFALGGSSQVIGLTSGQLEITDSLLIRGPAADLLTVSGGGSSRVIAVVGGADASAGIVVSIKDLTIAEGSAEQGGGILNTGHSTLTLHSTVLTNNTANGTAAAAGVGGAILNSGEGASLTVISSTIVGNQALGASGNEGAEPGSAGTAGGDAAGGGIANQGGAVEIIKSSLAGNSARGGNGGRGANGVDRTGSSSSSAVGGPGGAGGTGGTAYAGGVFSSGGTVELVDSVMERNTLVGGAGGAGGNGGTGSRPAVANIAGGAGGLGGAWRLGSRWSAACRKCGPSRAGTYQCAGEFLARRPRWRWWPRRPFHHASRTRLARR